MILGGSWLWKVTGISPILLTLRNKINKLILLQLSHNAYLVILINLWIKNIKELVGIVILVLCDNCEIKM